MTPDAPEHIDSLTRSANDRYAVDGAARAVGIELLRVWEGGAEMRMPVTEGMLNAHGISHGGYVFLLADTTFAYAYGTRTPAPVTRTADAAFLAASGRGDVLTATGRERHRAARSAVYDVTVTRAADGGDHEVIGEFRFHGVDRAPTR